MTRITMVMLSQVLITHIRPIETFFDKLGLTEDIWKGVVKALRVTDPDALKDLGRFLAGHAEFLTFFKTIGKVLGVGEVVLDFVTERREFLVLSGLAYLLGRTRLSMDS